MKRDDEVRSEMISLKRVVERGFRRADSILSQRIEETENEYTGVATDTLNVSIGKLAQLKKAFIDQINVVEQDWAFRNNFVNFVDDGDDV